MAADNKKTKTVRVDVTKLDDLMKLIGELVISRTRLTKISKDVESDDIDKETLKAEMSSTAAYIGRISTELQEQIMKMRMVPVSNLFSRFPRVIRDLSRALNKKVRLELYGEETELDRTIIENLSDPMVHLVRNAIDHGIEPPEERVAAGKPEEGLIKLIAYAEGNNIIIEIVDDGRGIDVKKVAQKALEKNIVTQAELERMSEREILNLIFKPGFSTAEKVTDVSGRGVGMDVVATAIEKLKGVVELQTQLGQGTRVILKLPLTLAIIDALLIKSGGEIFAIPINVVQEVIPIKLSEIENINGEKLIRVRGEVYKVSTFEELMERVKFEPKNEKAYMVLIAIAEKRVGILVDEMIGQEEVVVKSLGDYLKRLEGIAGVTILGDGKVILILDAPGLVRRMERLR